MRQFITIILAISFTLVISKSKYIQTAYEAVVHLSGYNFTYSSLKVFYNIPSASMCATICVYPKCLSFTFNSVDKVCRLFARRFLCSYNVNKANNTIYYVKKAAGQPLHHHEKELFCLLLTWTLSMTSDGCSMNLPLFQHCENIVPTECQDLHLLCCEDKDGLYDIYPDGKTKTTIYCLMARGGWTVFQRRMDGSVDFYRTWTDYENFFGSIAREYWLGNKLIHKWTSDGQFQLRVDLEDFEGNTSYGEWTNFALADTASKYTLTALGFSGTAQDSLAWHNGNKFSTFDQDNDGDSNRNCAAEYLGGWWYVGCHSSNLNGKYLGGPIATDKGMSWNGFRGLYYSLKACSMAFRRGTF